MAVDVFDRKSSEMKDELEVVCQLTGRVCPYIVFAAGRVAAGVNSGRLEVSGAEQEVRSIKQQVGELCRGRLVERRDGFPPMCPADPHLADGLAISEL